MPNPKVLTIPVTRAAARREEREAALRREIEEAQLANLDTHQTLQTIDNLLRARSSQNSPGSLDEEDLVSRLLTHPTHPPDTQSPPRTPTPVMTSTVNMPMANSREAPRFASDSSSFDTFFEDVEELATRSKLEDSAKIKWAIRYAGAESEPWKSLPCMIADRAAPTFAQFKSEVLLCYPHLSDNRRYTNSDFDRLLERTRSYQEMTRDDFGEYYRKFITYSSYLVAKDRLSERERSNGYLKGFPQNVRSRILHRLSIKKPDVLPDDGYKFADIHDAATFVLNTSCSDGSADVKKETTAMDDLLQAMSNLTRVFTANMQGQRSQYQPTPGGVSQNVPRGGQGQGHAANDQQECIFCSGTDHFVRDCHVAKQYLEAGKVIRNEYGKLSLPDGSFPSRMVGRNMREKFDKYWIAQGIYGKEGSPSQDVAETHFLEGIDECVFTVDVGQVDNTNYSGVCEEDEVLFEAQRIQTQIDALRGVQALAIERGKKKLQFDGVEIMKRKGPPNPGAPIPPPPPKSPTVHARVPVQVPQESQPSQSQPATNAAHDVSGKPGTRAGDTSQQRPQGPMRNVAMLPKPAAEDPKYRYQSAIKATANSSDLAERILDARLLVSAREILAVSPDVRRQIKEAITSKKVSVNATEANDADAFLVDASESKSSQAYLDFVKYDSANTAAPCLPLRVIYPTFAPGVEPECILDGGAQVVVMRKDIWERLKAPIVTRRAMHMESANAATTMTLGVIENQPVQLGSVTIYLQIQVIENAPFEVLLGRPFFDITSCSERSSPGGNHEIHIKDPQTGEGYTFATQPRVRKPIGPPVEIYNPAANGNFRL